MMILRVRLPNGTTERISLSDGEGLQELGTKIEQTGKLEGQFSLYADVRFSQPFVFENARHGDFVFIKGAVTIDSEVKKPEPMNTNDNKPGASTTIATSIDTKQTINEEKEDDTNWRPRCRHGPRGMCEHCMPKEDKRQRYESELAKWKGRGMSVAVMEALEALKFKITAQEEAHASAALVDNAAANEFQAYLAKTSFSQQRVGICYGDVDDSGQTRVHAIYEPPQKGTEEQYKLTEGEEAGDMTQRADTIAGMIGMRKVGLVFSARPRKSLLSGYDVVFAAKMLSSLSEEERKAFVILVVSIAESGETLFEAYQLSDLAVEMFQADAFEEEEKQKANGGRVFCSQEVLVQGKDTKKAHTEFFLLNIPIKSHESWLSTGFAIENRDIAPQGPGDLKKIVEDRSKPYWKRLSDFHAILFLSNMFDMKTDMPGLVDAIKAKQDDIGEGYRLMIEGMATS